MALLRLNCSPSANYFSTHQQQLNRAPLQKPLNPKPHNQFRNVNNFSLSWSHSHSTAHTSPIRTRRIQFSSTAQAQTVYSSPSSSPVAVSAETQEPQTETAEEEFSRTRLIAQNIPWTCTTEDIRALFERHGKVLDVELSMHNKTRNRGLAFVTMGSPEEALTALSNLESYEFEGRLIKVNYAKLRKKKPSFPVKPRPLTTFNLFVANLPYEARSKDLKEFFDSGSGNVASAEVIFHENPRKPSGYGFVAFKSKKEADEALSAFEGKIFMGRPIRVGRSKQFVKAETQVSAQSEDASTELVSDVEESEKADEN